MHQAVHSDLVLYADDSDLTFQHKDIHKNEHKIDTDFANLGQWFIDKNYPFQWKQNKMYTFQF